MAEKTLSDSGKEQLAVALRLLGDWKSQGFLFASPEYQEVLRMVLGLVDHFGVEAQYNKVSAIMPPMIIKPKN